MYKEAVSADDYRRALEAALREYEDVGQQRAILDRRLAELHRTISSLTRLCGLTPTVSLGLTDGCRMVLKAAGRPLTAVEVRDELAAWGFDVSKYANDLASIHTVLKRLDQAGETRPAGYSTGRRSYVWARGPAVIAVAGTRTRKR
jgi:hypothetical protein